MLRDGKLWERPFPDLPEEDDANQYDDLLRLLIPPNLAQFYFFDGERVRELFKKASAENISQAIRDLLGLSLLERLVDDLRDYRRTTIPRLYGKHHDKQAALLQAQGEREQLRGEIQRLEAEAREIEEDLSELGAKITEKENEFRRLGGLQQVEVDQIKEQEQQCKLEHERLTAELKAALGDQISVSFLLPLKAAWEKRIEKEAERRRWLTRREAIEPYIKRLIDRLVGPNAPQPEPPLTRGQTAFFTQRIEEEVKGLWQPPPAEASEDFWFDLRQEEIDQIRKLFEEALRFSLGRVQELVEAKERVSAQRRRLLEKLQSLGDTEATQAIAKEIAERHQKKGSLNQKRSDLETEIAHRNDKLTEIERQITNLERNAGNRRRGRPRATFPTALSKPSRITLSRPKSGNLMKSSAT